eukprot:TRINITY_DN358_c0_g2_i1.p1 TRINITY_DN358_c0_g2~~TRINITY_DN358_c0_g2_i1.p1  ORF type:complete len:422 (+),score=109.47 TRINITY_DN358_c0_g2_i1:53-1267(+)
MEPKEEPGAEVQQEDMTHRIWDMITDRTKARRARNFEEADAIREELRAMGVRLDDTSDSWVFEGIEHDENEFVALLQDRWRAKRQQDFETCDELREKLRRWGVKIDDECRSYILPSGATGTHESTLTTEEITELTAQRAEAVANNDDEAANKIFSQLSAEGVSLNDLYCTWTAGDRWGAQNPTHPASELTLRYIVEKVNDRLTARRRKDWDLADSIRTELQDQGVSILDKEDRWSTKDGRNGAVGDIPERDIEIMLNDRSTARGMQDYDKADQIRDDLSVYGVTFTDRLGTWQHAASRRSGMLPGYEGKGGGKGGKGGGKKGGKFDQRPRYDDGGYGGGGGGGYRERGYYDDYQPPSHGGGYRNHEPRYADYPPPPPPPAPKGGKGHKGGKGGKGSKGDRYRPY